MCIGCGVCVLATRGSVTLASLPGGAFLPVLDDADDAALERASRVCPFSDDSLDESVLAETLFGGLPEDDFVGRHLTTYAGRVRDHASRLRSSSGGLTTWLVRELLREEQVDAVIHVRPASPPGAMFEYRISTTEMEIDSAKRSHYSAASLRDLVNDLGADGRRFAFIGVPCIVRAMRSVERLEPGIADVRFHVGLVCGHMKSPAYGLALAWQAGISPEKCVSVDFRVKVPGRESSDYDFAARGDRGTSVSVRSADLLGTNWGHAMFQPNACNYCDDVFAETADVVLGDAWLPEYRGDWMGTNVIVTRNAEIDAILRDGRDRGEIELESLDLVSVRESQAGNYRHRRTGLAVRLKDDERAGRPAPRKRVEASYSGVTFVRRQMVRLRREISEYSHVSFQRAVHARDVAVFVSAMKPLLRRYSRLESIDRKGIARWLASELRRLAHRAVGAVHVRG